MTPSGRRPGRRLWPWLVIALLTVAGVRLASQSPAAEDRPGTAANDAATTATPSAPEPLETVQSAPRTLVLVALQGLPVAADVTTSAYDRAAFGAAWTDTDRNGCDTRNDVLRRDLSAVVLKPGTHGCAVLSGSLRDPYSGATLAFTRGRSTIQVDHVVSLGDAWRSGASAWPYAKLLAFANDPLELLAVSGRLNESKGDSDAAGWLPPSSTCRYAATQVAVKAKYGLRVNAGERAALVAVLRQCPTTLLPTGGTPTLAPNRSPAPRATTAPAPAPQRLVGTTGAPSGDPDYGTCKNAKAHGAGPYRAGQDPEYDYYQDRDHDGIVCE